MIGSLSSVNDLIKDPDLVSEKLQHNSDLSPWKMRGRGRPKHSLSTQRNNTGTNTTFKGMSLSSLRPKACRNHLRDSMTSMDGSQIKGFPQNSATFLGAQVVWGCYNLTGKWFLLFFLKGNHHLILLENVYTFLLNLSVAPCCTHLLLRVAPRKVDMTRFFSENRLPCFMNA